METLDISNAVSFNAENMIFSASVFFYHAQFCNNKLGLVFVVLLLSSINITRLYKNTQKHLK